MPLSGQTIEIKVGSLAPLNSPWDKALRQMGQEWSSLSGGKVKLKVYAGAVMGGEESMLRKIEFGQLQGASFSTSGMARIDKDFLALAIPMTIRDDEELLYVVQNVRNYYEKKMLDKGYIILAWTAAGWMNLFSKTKILTPDDLKQKMLSSPSEDMLEVYKSMGFKVTIIPYNETITALSNGTIEALYTTPLLAGSYQWFGVAGQMQDMKYVPIIGAIVVSLASWNQIPADLRPALLAAARTQEIGLFNQTRTTEEEVLKKMKEKGLVVNTMNAAQRKLWQDITDAAMASSIGIKFSKEAYDVVNGYLKKYRSANGK
jgi:TRAP-type C4-dicarboxylate transport system substrate-binding protein